MENRIPKGFRKGGPVEELVMQRYIDGRLDTVEQEALQDHLKRDSAARRSLDGLREEEQLIRTALECPRNLELKIGDKVMVVLYGEYRKREAIRRAKVFRNRLLAAFGAAALLLLGLFFVKPQEHSGTMISGCDGVRVQNGERIRLLAKDGPVYEKDIISTRTGQFVRFSLIGGGRVDLDEASRLRIDKGQALPVLVVEKGSARILVQPEGMDLFIKVPDERVLIRAMAGSEMEVVLTGPSGARWPFWSGAWDALERASLKNSGQMDVFVTGLKGRFSAHPKGGAGWLEIREGQRAHFNGEGSRPTLARVKAFHALDYYREGLARFDGMVTRERSVLGLLEGFSWPELARAMDLIKDHPQKPGGIEGVEKAIKILQEASQARDPASRSELFFSGQRMLRAVTQGLPAVDTRRWMARTLEGLANFERGRALLAYTELTSNKKEAAGAFLGAAASFFEALSGVMEEAEEEGQTKEDIAKGLSEEASHLKIDLATRWHNFTVREKAFLLASFFQPWALYQFGELTGSLHELQGMDRDPVPLFATLQNRLGGSVEALASRFGLGLALIQAGRRDEAILVLDELKSSSVAGQPEGARTQIEGLRQAALFHLARLYEGKEPAMAMELAEEFFIRYPLDGRTMAGKALGRLVQGAWLREAQKALAKRDYALAEERFTGILTHPFLNATLPEPLSLHVRLGLVQALMGRGKADEARSWLNKIDPQGPGLGAVELGILEALKAKLQVQESTLPQKP